MWVHESVCACVCACVCVCVCLCVGIRVSMSVYVGVCVRLCFCLCLSVCIGDLYTFLAFRGEQQQYQAIFQSIFQAKEANNTYIKYFIFYIQAYHLFKEAYNWVVEREQAAVWVVLAQATLIKTKHKVAARAAAAQNGPPPPVRPPLNHTDRVIYFSHSKYHEENCINI